MVKVAMSHAGVASVLDVERAAGKDGGMIFAPAVGVVRRNRASDRSLIRLTITRARRW